MLRFDQNGFGKVVGALILSLFFFVGEAQSQNTKAEIRVVKGEKAIYSVNDQISVEGWVQLPAEICEDGMDNTKLFLAGLEVLKDGGWQRDTCNYWIRKMDLKVLDNRKGISKITLMRKADKGEFFAQLKLDTSDTGDK